MRTRDSWGEDGESMFSFETCLMSKISENVRRKMSCDGGS